MNKLNIKFILWAVLLLLQYFSQFIIQPLSGAQIHYLWFREKSLSIAWPIDLIRFIIFFFVTTIFQPILSTAFIRCTKITFCNFEKSHYHSKNCSDYWFCSFCCNHNSLANPFMVREKMREREIFFFCCFLLFLLVVQTRKWQANMLDQSIYLSSLVLYIWNISMYMSVLMYMWVCTLVWMYVHRYVYSDISVCACMSALMYVCVCVLICAYIH